MSKKERPYQMKIQHLLYFLAFIFSGSLYAQEVLPVYSDYLTDNLYLLHPSMAGASNMNKIRLTARQQWFEVEDAPSLQTLSLHARVRDKVGLGGILFNDANGYFSKRGAYATFTYHLLFSRSALDLNQLSFGLSGGLIQHQLDQTTFVGSDPLLGENNSDFYANMDLGLSYYYFNFFAHATVKNVLVLNRELFFTQGIPVNQRQYIFSTGHVFHPQKGLWSYEPSLLFQWKEATGEKNLDLNGKVYRNLKNGQLFGGLSYRISLETLRDVGQPSAANQRLQYVTPFVGWEYRNFLLAYTYSYQANEIHMSSSGFHQITLGYNFGQSRARYDCACPAINQNCR